MDDADQIMCVRRAITAGVKRQISLCTGNRAWVIPGAILRIGRHKHGALRPFGEWVLTLHFFKLQRGLIPLSSVEASRGFQVEGLYRFFDISQRLTTRIASTSRCGQGRHAERQKNQ